MGQGAVGKCKTTVLFLLVSHLPISIQHVGQSGHLPQFTPGFLVNRLMQGSSCSHLGTTRLPSSFDHDSLFSIGSNTFSGDAPVAKSLADVPLAGVAVCGVANFVGAVLSCSAAPLGVVLAGGGVCRLPAAGLCVCGSVLPSVPAPVGAPVDAPAGAFFGLKNPCSVLCPLAAFALAPLVPAVLPDPGPFVFFVGGALASAVTALRLAGLAFSRFPGSNEAVFCVFPK